MGQVQENREKLASVIGAKLANEFADDQLPAMLHAIDGNEHEVRTICQQVSRQHDVRSPATLILWKLRERKHTGLVPEPVGGAIRSTAPPVPDPAVVAANKKLMAQWKRVLYGIRRSQELKDLYDALIDSEPPAEVRRVMTEAMDEMNAAKEARA